MKKLNRRTKVVILSVILALLFAGVYAAGLLLPDSLAEPSFLNTKLPPSRQHLSSEMMGRSARGGDVSGLVPSWCLGQMEVGGNFNSQDRASYRLV